MNTTLAEALEAEHREIDGGIERCMASLEAGGSDTEPLLTAMAALRRHIYLEEEFLFPPMKIGGTMMAVIVMIREHGEIWRQMDALDKLLAAGATPRAVSDACTVMLETLETHNSKEEPIIYTKAEDILGHEATGSLAEFIESGAMPEGWTAQSA